MFDKDKKYWISFSGETKERINVKGVILEETPNIIKLQRDNGNISFIIVSTILSINEDRNENKL